jgi:U3 small nucleolar RNA-associated protein 10
VHEYNAQFLVLTFLPYHTMPMFATLLSILPRSIPPTLKFLHPYIKSLACPPRRVIVHAATHNQAFFNALNDYILDISRVGHQYSTIISYWATVATEALTGLVDLSKSGRQEVQRQKEGDILLQILPVLNEGLSIRQVPDLRVACYMIATVLASKMDLEDKVLTAMMEAAVKNWDLSTAYAGLICIAVLAQQRRTQRLPKAVFKAVMTIEHIEKDLWILNEQYQVDSLTLGLILGVLDNLHQSHEKEHLEFIRIALEKHLVGSRHLSEAIRSIVAAADKNQFSGDGGTNLQGRITNLLIELVSSEDIGMIVKDVLKESNVEQLASSLQAVLLPVKDIINKGIAMEIDVAASEEQSQQDDFDILAKKIPTRNEKEVSFLSNTESRIFGSLAAAFGVASSSGKTIEAFSELPVLRKSTAMIEPLYLSFFVRYWCSSYPNALRSAAICCVRDFFKLSDVQADMQALLPYLLHALADPAVVIRCAAIDLLVALRIPSPGSGSKDERLEHESIWGKESIYGQHSDSKDLPWLTHRDMSRFVHEILLPHLEEMRLDDSFLPRLLRQCLTGSEQDSSPQKQVKGLKKQTRAALLAFLCSHVINIPLYQIQARLLQMLNGISKVGSTSRSNCLIPLLVAFEKEDESMIKEKCEREDVNQEHFMNQVAAIVAPSNSEGIRILHRIIALDDTRPPRSLRRAAFHRIHEIWPSMKHVLQLPLSKTLLTMAISSSAQGLKHGASTEAMELLRTVSLSADILISFLENRPAILPSLAGDSSHPKRRRTSNGHVQIKQSTLTADIEQSLRYASVVLELVEASKNGGSPGLLKNLFRLLTDLQHYQIQNGVEMAYLQSLVIGCIHNIVEASRRFPDNPVDRASVRADLIIDCFRTTTSPQVQQAALLLMSTLARVYPELIIHSIMPIFTFMGTTILRQSDDYSAHVVDQTIDSVIPPLAETLHKQNGGPLVGASELLLSFAAAFEHMPSHRRKALFSSLIDKLGVEEFLFALLVLLMDRYPDNGEVLDFVKDFMDQYTALLQLKTMNRYLEVAIDCLKPKPSISGSLLSLDDGRTRASTVLSLLSLPTEIFRAQHLISKAAKTLYAKAEDAKQLHQVYAQLVGSTLTLAGQIEPYMSLPKACDELLDSLLGLFSLEEIIDSLHILLLQGNDSVRRQVLRTLEHRISTEKSGNPAAQRACIDLLPQLVTILDSSPDHLLCLGATSCTDRIMEKYARKDSDRFSQVLGVVASDRCLGADEPRLRVVALLCLATAVEALGEVIIPLVPKALPKAVQHLGETLQEEHPDENLHNAVYSFLEALLLYVPWIVTGQYLDQTLAVSYQSAISDLSIKCNESRIDALDLIAKQTTTPECLAALNRTWNLAMEEGPEVLSSHRVPDRDKLTILLGSSGASEDFAQYC